MEALGTVGAVAVLDGVVTREDPKPRGTNTRVLVLMQRMKRPSEMAKNFFSAQKVQQHGYMMVVPAQGETGETTVHRWTLHPAIIEAGHLVRPPSLRPDSRVLWICGEPTCRESAFEWRGVFRYKYAQGYTGSLDGFTFKCRKCGGTAVAAELTSTVTKPGPGNDPIFPDREDPLLPELKMVWQAGDPDREADIPLPSLWAGYAKGDRPDTPWVPCGAKEEALVVEAAGKGMEVLPYSLARNYHSPSRPINSNLVDLWVDMSPIMGFCWKRTLENTAENLQMTGWSRYFVPRETAKRGNPREGLVDL